MSAASKKFVIGLTGNIATGKSVVRKMLEHLGAYGIDADALTHRAMAKGAPGFSPIVDEFGKYILNAQGEIDRGKLGKLVFSDPEALEKLEEIVHPLVRQAVDHLIKNASQRVVVVEAIKLLESPIKEKVDSVWVATASEKTQIDRLAAKRGMNTSEAQQRMANQSSQAEKMNLADVVIKNDGDFDATWKQVQAAWKKLFPDGSTGDTVTIPVVKHEEAVSLAEVSETTLNVVRAKPKQAQDIADFINRLSPGNSELSRMDIMAAFGEKAYMMLMIDNALVGLVGWQVENLVARTDEVWLETDLDFTPAITALICEVEEAAKQLQAEAALVFVKRAMAQQTAVWEKLGYESRAIESLSVNAWQEAAKESIKPNTDLLFKQLRIDRVLRPI